MINTSSYVGIILMIILGLALPIGLIVWWLKSHHEKISTVLVGVVTWFLFAIILETIPKIILLTPLTPIGKTISNNPLLITLIGASLAGIFEETGRFIAFKTVLKKKDNKETAISHGIGHGGFEAMYILVISGIQYLIFALMINAGRFDEIISAASQSGTDISSLESLPEQIAAISILTPFTSIFERIFAILLHIGLSIMVFYAVKKSRTWIYILAILSHSLFDVPAALYQVGVITNVYIVEGLFAVYAIVFFVLIYKLLYKKYSQPETIESK